MYNQFTLYDIVEECDNLWCIFLNNEKILKIKLLDVINQLNMFNNINKLIGMKFVIYNNTTIYPLIGKNATIYSCLSSGY